MARSLWDWDVEGPFFIPGEWGSPMLQLRSAMGRLFDDFGREVPWTRVWPSRTAMTFPRINISEDSDRFHLEAELPGIAMDALDITCLGRELTLRGHRGESDDPESSFVRRERAAGSFVRMVTFPAEVDASKVTATLEDGILEIAVPKSEGAKPRRIEIHSAGSGAGRVEMPEKEA